MLRMQWEQLMTGMSWTSTDNLLTKPRMMSTRVMLSQEKYLPGQVKLKLLRQLPTSNPIASCLHAAPPYLANGLSTHHHQDSFASVRSHKFYKLRGLGRIYVYIYIYICIYVRMYVCMYVCMHMNSFYTARRNDE